jgi:hypothetical protein
MVRRRQAEAATGPPRGPRAGRRGDEQGASLVEFALVVPLLAIFLFGIIDFGSLFANYESLRQGVQEAGRQAAVDVVGSSTTCGLSFVGSPPSWAQELMCSAYGQIPQSTSGTNTTSVKLVLTTGPNSSQPGFVQGNTIKVCAAVPMKSLSGLFTALLNTDWMTTSASYFIEQTPPSSQFTQATNGTWTAGSSSYSWSWCS